MTRVLRSLAAIRAALRDTAGAASVWAIMWMLGFMMLGGVAVDVSNAYAMKSRLQSIADASALAAVMQIDDRDAARAAAVTLAARNMPEDANGNVILSSDVRFGVWDADTGDFVEVSDDEPAEAVQILAGRTLDRGNAVPTYLVRLVGRNEWELGAASVATTSSRAPVTPPGGGDPDCVAATILSTGNVDTGGGNEFGDGVCIYGEDGVQTGGDDCFEDGAHIMSPSADDIDINSPSCGTEEEIVVEREIEPVLLPKIHGGLFSDIYTAVNNAGKKWGDDESPEDLALLPEHFIGHNIMRINIGWWTIQPNHLRAGYIYLVDHGVQFAGGVDIQNVALIVDGQIGTGGGDGLKFDDVFFFATGQLNFSGDVMWGTEGSYCENGEYSVYLFSEQSLSLGGFGPDTGVYGVMGAAPRFSPGGAMKNAGGLYIETEGWTSLGGNMRLTGCDVPLASMYDGEVAGSLLGGGDVLNAVGDLVDAQVDGDSGAAQVAAGAVLGASLVR